ncbi:MAG: hypothetical protein FWF40_01615, partial [Methanomassiliicoccaceae archaeon]|nr:hypothetical protein [Methanomassiliicoccaceae archaeon]
MRSKLAPIVSVFAVSLLLLTALSPLAFNDFGEFSFRDRGGTDGYEDFGLAAGPISTFANTNYFRISTPEQLSWVGDGKAHHYNNNNTSNIWAANANYYLANDIVFGTQDLNGVTNVNFSISRSGTTLTLTFTGNAVQNVYPQLYLIASTNNYTTGTFNSAAQTFTMTGIPDGTYALILSVSTTAGVGGSCYISSLALNASSANPSTGKLDNGNFNSLPMFNGTFDGNGFEIRGMKTQAGLFYYMGDNGVIKNLGVTGGSVEGVGVSAGGIVGSSSGTFINCYNTSPVFAVGSMLVYAGGISGGTYGGIQSKFFNCYNTGSVTTTAFFGKDGSEAYASGIGIGDATNCYNRGNITSYAIPGGGGIAGGIGARGGGLIANCYNTGTISGYSESSGGIIGIGAYARIVNCYTLTSTLISPGSYNTTIDSGTASPARKITTPHQSSGTKNATVMTPTLADAKANNSIYYTGTVTPSGYPAVPGWDFNSVWTITPGVNNGYPVFLSSHSVTTTLTNMTSNIPSSVNPGATLSGTITPNTGYSRPASITVTMGGTTLAASGYSYSSSTGAFSLANVTGNVVITATGALNSYSVTRTLTNLTSTIPSSVNHGATLSGTITPGTGYGLPSSITVTMGGTTLAASGYSYSSSTGAFSLANVTGNVVITASGLLNSYTVTRTLTNLSSNIPATINHGTTLSGTITPNTGYGLPASITVTVGGSTVLPANYTYNSSTGVFSLPGTYVTGNVVITASGLLNSYTVTRTLTNMTSTIPATVNHGAVLSGTITPNTGYNLPSSITVTVGGSTVLPANYTYNSSNGTFSLPGTYVTGNVVITASGLLNSYTVTR